MNRAPHSYDSSLSQEKTKIYHYPKDRPNTIHPRKVKPRLFTRNRCCSVNSKDSQLLKDDDNLATKPSLGQFLPNGSIMRDEISYTTPSKETTNVETTINSKSVQSSFSSYEYDLDLEPLKALASPKSKRSVSSQTYNEQYLTELKEQFGLSRSSSEKLQQTEYILKAKKFSQISASNANAINKDFLDGPNLTWHEVNDIHEAESLINKIMPTEPCLPQKTVHIAKKPRVKVIAEKYFKYNKNGFELRKLLEKIYCLEYDIFVADTTMEPTQVMRLYFLMKPVVIKMCGQLAQKECNPSKEFLHTLKHECNVPDEELTDANDYKQVEFMDGHVSPNKTYIDDIRKLLYRNGRISAKKAKSSLDLYELYEAAKRNKPILDSMVSQTLISKGQMKEVKDLITTCMLDGINTRNIKRSEDKSLDKLIVNLVSNSVVQTLYTGSGVSPSKLKKRS